MKMWPVVRPEHLDFYAFDVEDATEEDIECVVLVLKEEVGKALKLLKQAGDNLDIRTSQEVRALRFKILQFLEDQDG